MSAREIDIADMQCWIFRMAQKKWGLNPENCAKVFRDNDILGYIERCYDLLHLSSYACALDDVENMLRKRGVFV